MNTEQFAQKIKSKYPQYANVDSVTLVNKIVEQYPDYKNKITDLQPKQGIVSSIGSNIKQQFLAGGEKALESFKTTQQAAKAGSATGILRGALGMASGGIQTVASPITGVAQEVAETKPVQSAIRTVQENIVLPAADIISRSPKLQQFAINNPNAEEVITDVLNVAGTLYSPQVARGTGAAVESAAGKTLSTTGDIVASTGSKIKDAGSKLYQAAITPNVKEAEGLLQSRILGSLPPITRAKTALEKGLVGTQEMIAVKGGKTARKLYQEKISPALESTVGVVSMNKDELFSPIIERINKTVDPTKKKSLQEAFDAIKEDYDTFPNQFDLVTAQGLKRDLDMFTPEKIFRGRNVASELKTLNNDMANAIRSKTYDALADRNIKKDYIDYGNLVKLEDIGVKSLTEAGRFAGAGSLVSYFYDKALTPVQTIGGQVLYRVGNALEFVGKKGLKTFGEFLKSKGINIKSNNESSVKKFIDLNKNTPNKQGGFIKNPLSQSDELIKEARKYKSAEEFVKAKQPITHYTSQKFDKFDLSKTEAGSVWFTDNPNINLKTGQGLGSAQVGSGGAKYKMDRYINPKSKIIDIEKSDLTDKYTTGQLIDMGYSGVKVPQLDGSNWYEIWEPNKDLLTKFQLKQIWKEANKK